MNGHDLKAGPAHICQVCRISCVFAVNDDRAVHWTRPSQHDQAFVFRK